MPDPRHPYDRRRDDAAWRASGAVAGLCPITEANLGDGIFPRRLSRGRRPLRRRHGFQRADRRRPTSCASSNMPSASRTAPATCWRRPAARPGARCSTRRSPAAREALGAGAARHRAGRAGRSRLARRRPSRRWPAGPATRLLDAWIFADGSAVDCVWVRRRQAGQRRPASAREADRRARFAPR